MSDRAAIRSATSRSAGPSGTASIATTCATSGAATRGWCPSSRRASSGSSDIYQRSARGAYASVNFVVAHDGFTLHDLVSYEQKHNEANGEDNRDGTDDNLSRNWGAEGRPTTEDPDAPRSRDAQLPRDARVLAGRADALARRRDRAHAGRQQQRLRAGQRDHLGELGSRRARAGNSRVHAARSSRSVARTRCCADATSSAASPSESGAKELIWLRPDGQEMTDADWHDRRATRSAC